MSESSKSGGTVWRSIPIAIKVLVLCLIALVALFLVLPPPPGNDTGGVTTVTKHVPPLRETVDPLADRPAPAGQVSVLEGIPPATPEQPSSAEQAQSGPEPETAAASGSEPERESPPAPVKKPENTSPSPPPGNTGQAAQDEGLPWQREQNLARLEEEPPPAPAPSGGTGLPSKSDIRGWVRSQAWEFLGGVDEEGNILYRFELWLQAPENTLGAIKSVSYDYDAPSATPKSRKSTEPQGGFRVRFGSLACSKNVTVTVAMADGSTRTATVDGCSALN